MTAVDYDGGVLLYTNGSSNASVGVRVTWRPIVTLSRSALSLQAPIAANTRGYVYLASLNPIPAPGTTVVSYRALGRWYELVDDGTGQLSGELGTGSGQVNYVTGAVSVTLGALPDIGSSVVFAWGGTSELEIRTGDGAIQSPRVDVTLAHELEPDSLSLTWLAGGLTKTATCNVAGVISGDAVGYVIPSERRVIFRPTALPDDNTTIAASYGDYDVPYVDEVFTPSIVSDTVTVTLADPPKPGTVTITTLIYFRGGDQADLQSCQLRDDGAGNFTPLPGTYPAAEFADITINYGTGAIVIPATVTMASAQPVYQQLNDSLPAREEDAETGLFGAVTTPRRKAVGSAITSGSFTFNDSGVGLGGLVSVRYVEDGADVGSPYTDMIAMPDLQVDLTPNVTNAIVPGSVRLAFGGRIYVDRQGALYHTINAATGAGTLGGAINYTTGVATISDWASNAAPAFSVQAMLTEIDPVPVSVVHARAPGSPLRPGSFFLQANRSSDGALITGVAGTDGNIDTADMHGYVDVVSGVFSVAFGAYVLDSSLDADDKAEPWYNAANVDGDGYIWRPREVVPGSVRFSCVVQTMLPLDPDIIGVNPVRLPLDGRVQTIRAGDTLVIHDTQSEALTNPAVAGATDALSRGGLASVTIYDTLGAAVDPALYTVDLVAGSITWDDPLNLSAYTQPLTALHTIEDMALCTDAQITGDVTLAQALTHGFTADNSLVSSALILGDVQARVEHLFAQNTWTGVWSNERIGAAPVSGAQYNDVTYPLAVTNQSAITQRWRLTFTSSSAFTINAEDLGQLGTGSTAANVAPINPATGDPYFVLDKNGFGTGWATGNSIRFNTVAAGAPVWVGRTVRSGPASFVDDQIKIQTRWDKD